MNVLIMMKIKGILGSSKRYVNLLRPLNKVDGRDVIELLWRLCNEGNDE